ncbi:MAG: hypothetical protein GY950_16140, partial [bacterium]|nr:hypothetical protein [bacterium]
MRKEFEMGFPLSDKIEGLDRIVKRLKQKYLQLWWDTDTSLPVFFKSYSTNQQKALEKEMSRMVDKLLQYVGQYLPASRSAAGMDFSDPVSLAKEYLEKLSSITAMTIDETFVSGFTRSTREFIDRVNSFDPSMPPENIYQALRNVWVMNVLQTYLNRDMAGSDSIFAYSMLYPYTDNIMDDASLPLEEKLRRSRNLKQRLEGKPFPQTTAGIEKKLDALVTLIERQFPREKFPKVFQSLLAIYNAQVNSLTQQQGNLPPYAVDIPALSFEKGGTSVLADGFLIKGELAEGQEDFCFGLGTFLQLADDIQDIVPDQKNNHMTMFSHVAGKYTPDALANKLFHYITAIVEQGLADPAKTGLKELLRKSFYFHIIEAVGKNRDLYSDAYIAEMQVHFPFRFSFFRKLRKQLNKVLSKQKQRTVNLDIVSAGLMALGARVYE